MSPRWLRAIAAIMWSLGGLLIKSIDLHPLAIAGIRSGLAAVVIVLVTRKVRFIWTWPQFAAALSVFLTFLLFVTATKMTTAANAILLQYTAPIYVALISWPLLGERVRPRDWITLALVVLGMIFFFIEKVSSQHMLGNIIALASGVSFAGTAVFLRLQKGQSTLESLLLGHMLMALVGIPFLLVSHSPTSHEMTLLLLLGIVQLGIPYILYGIAIRQVNALEATLILVIEPILNPVWVALFFGEQPSFFAAIGGTIVIGSILIHSLITAKAEKPKPLT
jgi:drug/metabolite transporter (DMT)-like permease